MGAILVRVGVDHSYGKWNAPVDPKSGRFVYVPIPDNPGKRYPQGYARPYTEVLPALQDFTANFGLDLDKDLRLPRSLLDCCMHLDPDFEHLTYGDRGTRRGAGIKTLGEDDLLVFYAGFRSIRRRIPLIYALVGLYVVKEVVPARTVPGDRRKENAHTRWTKISDQDIVVRAMDGVSGRLERCIPIGELRDRAYRVRSDILKAWGGLSVKDGYIQRSVRPPEFLQPERFYRWFLKHEIPLLRRNN